MTSPVPLPQPATDIWSRFAADPRTEGELRASDADRDVATQVLNEAFQQGRLDNQEHTDRLDAALRAKTLSDFTPLIRDLAVAPRPADPVAVEAEGVASRREKVRSGAIRSWIGLAVLFNLIWVASWLFSGHAPYYYWPIWPMIGTGIPVLLGLMGTSGGDDDEGPRQLGSGEHGRDLTRRERRRRRR